MEIRNVEVGMMVSHPKHGEVEVANVEKGWVYLGVPGQDYAKVRAKTIEPVDDTPYTMSKQLAKYRGGYQPTVSYSGAKSHHKGDDVSNLFAGSEPAVVIATAEKVCDLQPGALADHYARLNPGQQRMNAGNRIRSAIKRGDVDIDYVAKVMSKVS